MNYSLKAATIAAALSVTAMGQARMDYPISPVPMEAVRLDDGFWGRRAETNRRVTVPAVFHQCEITGRIDNFARAAGWQEGGYEGYFFNDSDVYKAIEGASYVLATHPDPELEAYLDEVIAKIAAAQQPDGYLNAHFTLEEPENRWTDLRTKHELYCAGHLFEAAVAHHRATGKRTLLDVAIRFADHIDATFGPDRRAGAPGHQEIEIGLVKLFRCTGERRYLDLAHYFLEQRGRDDQRELYGFYAQDHLPVVDQTEAIGHAVRAAYQYSGMADVAALTGNDAYVGALDRLWENVVGRKLYLTGGIGATRAGEAFGADYELPNQSAYGETCGAIANALWNHRMFLLHGDANYIDVLERTIYNGFLVGVSLSGDRFFYPNPLAADGVTPFNHGSRERSPWFACACCPVNVVRFVPSISGFMYATKADEIFVNLYEPGEATMDVGGRSVRLVQETRYPWEGAVRLTVEPSEPGEFGISLRVPGWAVGRPVPSDLYRYQDAEALNPMEEVTLKVNGQAVAIEQEPGFVRLRREWRSGDVIDLHLPMLVRRVVAHEDVEADRGRVAVEYGPIVYCVEGVDHDGKVENLWLPEDSMIEPEWRGDLLGGVVVLRGRAMLGYRHPESNEVEAQRAALTMIPYYAWNHRGAGQMAVWLPTEPQLAKVPPAPTVASRAAASASHCWSSDSPHAINDQVEPKHSNDHSIPRLTWWDHRGTTEWAQLDFAAPAEVSKVEVYWFDDTGVGQCRVPDSWRVLYRDGGEWRPVEARGEGGVAKDQFNALEFEPVTTDALRLEVQLRDGVSGGILEWKVE